MITGLVMVVPARLDRPTGGNRYDQALARALTDLGTPVELREVAGAWPVASPADRAYLATALAGPGPVLVDGLLACGAPGEVVAAARRRDTVQVLVHMPLALDPALTPRLAASRNTLEGRALRAATGVIATSEWSARRLRARHGLDDVTVAPPGAHPAPVATGSSPPLLLHLAAVSPLKNQLTLVDALALLADEPWVAELTGDVDVDPGYVAAVRARIRHHRLTGRVRLTGPVTGRALDRTWSAADVLLLPSRAETWGMAVTEGLARAIPAVVSRGTGAQEALGAAPGGEIPGALVDPRSAQSLAGAIRDLLGPGRVRARRAALARRPALPRWGETAAIVQKALT